MSKLGKTPIVVPKGVEITSDGKNAKVKGPKGTLEIPISEGISLKMEAGKVIVESKEKNLSVTHGLTRASINNAIEGVEKGFSKTLSLVGVGYRAVLKGKALELRVGFSHPIELPIPKDITVTIDKGGIEIIIAGTNKQVVGQFAADVRSYRKPEPYKGKGIRYINEYVRKKAGKAAAAAKGAAGGGA